MILGTDEHGLAAERVLQKAVRDMFRYKAKLGQYVVISRNGKPCKVPAAEALAEAEQAYENKIKSEKSNLKLRKK